MKLGRRLADRFPQLGVHEAQRLAVLGALQRRDDERGGGGRARERVEERGRRFSALRHDSRGWRRGNRNGIQ
jgi:hypothetical protein